MKKVLLILAMFSLFLFLGCVTETTTPEQTTDDSVLGSTGGTVQQPAETTGDNLNETSEPEVNGNGQEGQVEDAENLQEIGDQQVDEPEEAVAQETEDQLHENEKSGEPEETVENENDRDEIPDISVQDCLEDIKETNPEMSDQAANDNCYTIEAVNKKDPSLCDKVSESFKAICLSQFG